MVRVSFISPGLRSEMKPLVTVLIDTYNYGRFIDDAIQSSLNQTFPSNYIEIIVVDDGSTDDTPERVKKYKDKIRYIYKENNGQASAFNIGIKEAKGEYIILLDSDDYMENERVERVVNEFECYKDVVSVLNARRIIMNDKIIKDEDYPKFHNIPLNEENLQSFIAASYGTSRSAFRKSVLMKILPLPEKELKIEADLYLNLVMFFLGGLSCLKEPLTVYRVHGDNLFHLSSYEKLPAQIDTMKSSIKYFKNTVQNIQKEKAFLADRIAFPYEIEIKEKEFALNVYKKKAKRKDVFLIEVLKYKLNKSKWSWRYKFYKIFTLPFLLLLPPLLLWKLRRMYYEKFFLKSKD